MDSIELAISDETRENFWKAIKLFITKPHVLNRQLAGADQISVHAFNCNLFENIDEICEFAANEVESTNDTELVQSLQHRLEQFGRQISFDEISNEFSGSYLILNRLLSKNLKKTSSFHVFEIVDLNNEKYASIPICESRMNRPFQVELKSDENVKLVGRALISNAEARAKINGWLQHALLTKLKRWMEENVDETSTYSTGSLSLLNLSQYNELYNHLKVKYGEHMVKIWPERTDPSKFVFEDVAIATYLLLLWKNERTHMKSDTLQSFVDLGCGNGLLVYILSSEGHRGVGIDLRRRSIWDLFPATTQLREEAIVPSASSLFPDVDWIIGNHSDELSPWIPVIAARSSYKTRYFVLPCCAFEFNGKKYQRRNCRISQYNEFLNYAQRISEVCGFTTKIDRLKIPSTKRICIIGETRKYPETEFAQKNDEIQQFIDEESNENSNGDNQIAWNSSFTPRSNVERVRNCTKIDKTIADEIVHDVFDRLIAKKRYTNAYEQNWNVGGSASLKELVEGISRSKLRELKSECGGLQTLLKNNSQIFRVTNGIVEIRLPLKYKDKLDELKAKGIDPNDSKRFQFKQRSCWFLANHPDGCPLNDEDCSFKH